MIASRRCWNILDQKAKSIEEYIFTPSLRTRCSAEGREINRISVAIIGKIYNSIIRRASGSRCTWYLFFAANEKDVVATLFYCFSQSAVALRPSVRHT